MDKIQISVIIPVYNAERTLRQCVESILVQSFSNFEIILVNDGSVDESAALCNDLAGEDRRIRVLHKENGGASSARNAGIRAAQGEKLLFIDSDDFYESPALFEHLLSYDTDLVCFNYRKMNNVTGACGAPKIRFSGRFTGDADADLLLLTSQNAYADSACQKLVRTSVVWDNEVYFVEGLLGEDIAWNAKLMPFVGSAAFHNGECYVYRMVEGSASHHRTQKQIRDILSILDWMCAFSHPRLETEMFARAFYSYAAFNYCTTLANIRFVSKEYLKENLARCERHKWLLQYDDFKQVKLVHWAARLLGLRATSWLLHLRSVLVRKRYALED